MAHAKKRKLASGRFIWEAVWVQPDGTRGTKRPFPTKKAADAYLVKKEAAKLRGVEYDPKAGGVLFRDAAQSWLASRHDLKVTTLGGYRALLAPADRRCGDGKTLGIDAVFGSYPINRFTRAYISDWVQKLTPAGKKPSTVRHAYFVVRMVLAQAVIDGLLPTNPADYVRLPTEHSANGRFAAGVVDDPAQFLTAAQVDALVAATPWPFSIYVHVAAWAGLRAAEIGGLQIADVELPEISHNQNAAPRPGVLHVRRTAQVVDGVMGYGTPKTRGSRRRVPMTAETTELLREYLAEHPRSDDPAAPLFPCVRLMAQKPTGLRNVDANGQPVNPANGPKARRQATALGDLSVGEAERRLDLDWSETVRHATFYKAIYRPSVLRANRLVPTAKVLPELKFHSLRHTYASLCVAAGIPPLEISRFMGHAHVGTTLGV